MGKVNEYSLQLIEDWGDSVDIHYTQFLEVAFFLRVSAVSDECIFILYCITMGPPSNSGITKWTLVP